MRRYGATTRRPNAQDWDIVATYPNAFRSLVPVFTKYTDTAFPSDDPVDTTSRVALRFGVVHSLHMRAAYKRAFEVSSLLKRRVLQICGNYSAGGVLRMQNRRLVMRHGVHVVVVLHGRHCACSCTRICELLHPAS